MNEVWMQSWMVVSGLLAGGALVAGLVRLLGSEPLNGGEDQSAGSGGRRRFTEQERLAVVVEDPDDLPFQSRTPQEKADAELRAYAADENLRTRLLLTPGEMDAVRAAEELVEQAGSYMTGYTWLDDARGSEFHAELTRLQPRVFNPALVRAFLRAFDGGRYPRRLVNLGVKVGMPHSEEWLARMLHTCNEHGAAERIAVVFLNCGHWVLADHGQDWATAHGYHITTSVGGEAARWGRP